MRELWKRHPALGEQKLRGIVSAAFEELPVLLNMDGGRETAPPVPAPSVAAAAVAVQENKAASYKLGDLDGMLWHRKFDGGEGVLTPFRNCMHSHFKHAVAEAMSGGHIS